MLSGKISETQIKTNARVKYLPDDNGVYHAKSMTVFAKPVFVPDGWELSDLSDSKSKKSRTSRHDDDETSRKSYARARNNLFDLLLCTPSFNCFVTLTFNPDKVKRDDYKEIMKRLSVWLDNRVRRHRLSYVLVPEFHLDGKNIHFHGLMNFEALDVVRATNNKKSSQHYGQELFDDKGREIYNIRDFPFGHTTVIPIDGDNGREACAKYCFKYIVKSGGQKVGGRYYLSGGSLGRPRYEYINVDYNAVEAKEISIKTFNAMKRINFDGDDCVEWENNGN